MVFAVSVASSPKASPAGLVVGADVLGGLGGVCANAGTAIGRARRAANKPARIAKPIAFSFIERRLARFLMFVDLPLPLAGRISPCPNFRRRGDWVRFTDLARFADSQAAAHIILDISGFIASFSDGRSSQRRFGGSGLREDERPRQRDRHRRSAPRAGADRAGRRARRGAKGAL